METKELVIVGIVVGYVAIVFLFSRLGDSREIGSKRLFWLSLFLTPFLGLAFYLSSQHRKMNMYTERRYKCDDCGYVFSEQHDYCPFCEKEGKKNELRNVDMFMT
jgi:hypothetical protein